MLNTKCKQIAYIHTDSGSEQNLHRSRRSKVKKSKMAARLGGVNSGSAWKPNTDLKKREDNTKTKGLVLCHIFIFKVMTQPCPYCNDSCVDTAGWSWFQHMHHCIVVTRTRTCPRSYPLEVHALALASHNMDLS